MNFIVSFFLAVTASLATLALQLCNDGLDVNGGSVAVCSVFAIILALFLVDYKKLFALPRQACNVLLLAVVLSQSGVLFRSRQDFLAFSIANILALLQAVLFFQRKTTRIACQILVISLVEVAVGCVFQRSLYFVSAVPLYAFFAFLSLSMIFLDGERKYYASNVSLKERFSKRKKSRANVKEKAEKKLESSFDNAILTFGTEFLKRTSTSNNPAKNLLFFACPSSVPYGVTFEYFKRFALWSVGGAFCSALFFCLFPRFNQIGYGALQFEEVNWNVANVARLSQTGFNSSIELGDLGPALDSYEQAATVQFSLLDGAKRSEVVDPNSPIYFRGAALALYSDRRWTGVDETIRIQDASSLVSALQTQTRDPDSFLPSKILKSAKDRRPSPAIAPQRVDHSRRPFEPYPFPPANYRDLRETNVDSFPAPVLGYNPKPLSVFSSLTFTDVKDDRLLLNELKSQIVPLRNAIQYDSKSDVVAITMEAEPSDSPFVFHVRPFFVVSGTVPLKSTCASSVVPRSRPKRDFSGKLRFLFVTPAFHNGRQDVLTPNQENVWSFLPCYLTFEEHNFPRLAELARQWDSESGYDERDFIARARYLERKLRDSGEFKYNRTGVFRDPTLDPLEDFVSERREGHCEYFAGALTLMLRAVDIPARIVVGYAFNVDSKSKNTIVRQSDAHSWVEAFIPPKQLSYFASKPSSDLKIDPNAKWIEDGAWLQLDPTPAADREAERPGAFATGAHDWSSFVQSLGRDFILNFNGARQQTKIYAPIVGTYQTIVGCVSSLKNLAFSRSSSQPFKKFNVLVVLVLSLLCFVSFVVCRRLKSINFKNLRKRALRAKTLGRQRLETSVDKGTVALFLQIVQALERRLRIKRRQGETPLEFVERCLETEKNVFANSQTAPIQTTTIGENEPRVPISDATDFAKNYYLATFGAVPISSQEKKRWKEFLRSLKE